jgi:GTPase
VYSSSSTASSAGKITPILAPSNQSRQNRLQQLTTQLLWRLQQSSPYHASATSDLVLPKLPDAEAKLDSHSRPGRLLPGLEESRGALYEIGVSDDGTFVGLTKDEMDESLTNLRAMAASLGCRVEVLRMVQVGDCEWLEKSKLPTDKSSVQRSLRCGAQLWVAEALVTPDLSHSRVSRAPENRTRSGVEADCGLSDETVHSKSIEPGLDADLIATEQLRITLTGPTTSGKSSLLGTLSTATLDNGRGRSRQVLLKHRHELASGVTSSVAQELIGYTATSSSPGNATDVINFASANVSDWNDIHSSVKDGRLVFVCDSAGHPRYRRTTVRGLVGWAPHWTMLCIAADDGDVDTSKAGSTSTARDILGISGAGLDLVKAHLDLCLKLENPLCIIITKLDLASKSNLRQTLGRILSAIKGVGRVPALIPPDQEKPSMSEPDISSVPREKEDVVKKVIGNIKRDNLVGIVPIILTSAFDGTGIRSLHALLHTLPLPPAPKSHDLCGPVLNPEQPATVFHIEDVFGLPASYSAEASAQFQKDSGTVVAGHLRFGDLAVGDTVIIGPFPEDGEDDTGSPRTGDHSSPSRISGGVEPSSLGASSSHPSTSELARIASRNALSASVSKGEWYNARVVSIRNLRLPTRKLEAGQVGTIGIVIDSPEEELSNGPFERLPRSVPRIRKGMVLALPSQHMIETGHSLQAATGFTASFEDSDVNSVSVGSLVVAYIASIRATARIVRIEPHLSHSESLNLDQEDIDVFGLEDTTETGETAVEPPLFGKDEVTDVTLELITHREWIELGSQVLIMPGGGQGLYYGSERGEKGVAGLDGFVGKIIEVTD